VSVLVLHTLPPEHLAANRTAAEFDLDAAASSIAAVLPGAEAVAVGGSAAEIAALVAARRPGVVFNLCEAPLGRPALEAHVAALLEWMGQRFTGSGSETLALCRRKPRTYAMLAAAGIPIPREGVLPCVVKPADEDGSAGIDAASLCATAEQRDKALRRLAGRAVVQEFLPGREFAVSLWGRDGPEHASVGETLFLNGLRLVTYAAKWLPDSADYASTPIDYETEIAPALRAAVLGAARGAWRVVGAHGYLRVDVRLDGEGHPRVLDVNPNPDIAPGGSISRAVVEAGWAWEDFIRKLVEWA
jgi:D-alanine-D-alanine ligase